MSVAATAKYSQVPGEPLDSPTECGRAVRPHALPSKLYKRRWLMLAIFVLYSLCNACQWIQYSIISNVVEEYYGVSSYAVDWTSIVYMVTYFPLVLPATAFMDYLGLKRGMLAGAALTVAGSWVKCAAVAPGRFPLALAGQTLVAVAQVFVLGVPPQVASAWFGPREVATACSLAVFGNMLGMAAGFVVPPLLVRSHGTPAETQADLARLFYATAAFASLVLLLIAGLFQERPKLPPSAAAAARAPVSPGCLAPLRRLLANGPFCLLMAACAVNVAALSAIGTLLNQIVLAHFPDGEVFAGRLGLLMVVFSMAGSVACGIVLDRTHKFKEATVVLFALSLVSMVAMTFALPSGSQPLVYAAVAALGCFMGGYMPVGFEFASELTYPESENTTAGVLMGASQLLAVAFTVGYAALFKAVGDVWANLALSSSVLLAALLTVFIRPQLRRQEALRRAAQPEPTSDASDATDDTDVEAPPGAKGSPAFRHLVA